jgi:hypothetical protein
MVLCTISPGYKTFYALLPGMVFEMPPNPVESGIPEQALIGFETYKVSLRENVQ